MKRSTLYSLIKENEKDIIETWTAFENHPDRKRITNMWINIYNQNVDDYKALGGKRPVERKELLK